MKSNIKQLLILKSKNSYNILVLFVSVESSYIYKGMVLMESLKNKSKNKNDNLADIC